MIKGAVEPTARTRNIASMSEDAPPFPHVGSDDEGWLTGKLLIAMPGMDDPRFSNAVILLCAHSDEHAVGIRVNQTVEGVNLNALLSQLGVDTDIDLSGKPILNGGPVGRDRGFVLHTGDFETEEGTLTVTDDIRMTATKEALHAIASDMPPKRSLLALGYAGWGPGQLETEIANNIWLIADPENEIVFDDGFDDKWLRALARLGLSPEKLMGSTGSA